jgi:TolB-like protein
VRCAVKIQREIPLLDSDQPTDRAIRFRIGINLGDAIADGMDLHGDAVNVAARLQAKCPVGGICVSRPIRDHMQDRLKLPFEALGALRLKNIAWPVEAFALPQSWHEERRAPSFPIPLSDPEQIPRLSVVVLPFRTLGRRAEGDDLAEALTNDLTIELARIPGVLVIARASAVASREGATDFKRIGEELRVRYAIEGVMRQLGNKARVSVQLIATATSEQIWADRFDESRDTLAADSDAFVRRISTILDSRMLDAETARGLRERPHNPDAHDLLLRAWSLFKRPIERRYIVEASELLEQALRLEPNMVPAILSLADRLIHRFVTPDTMDWGNPELFGRAADLLAQVEQTEPNDEWLLFFRGSLLRAGGRWREAGLLLRRLIVEHPNNYAAHRMLARCEMIMGHPAEAIPHFQQGVHLDPLSPLNSVSHSMIGHCLLLQGKASEAIEPLQRGLSDTSDNERRSRGQQSLRLASAYALMGNMDRAAIALKEANESWPFGTIHSLWPFYEPRGLPTPAYTPPDFSC